MRAACRRAVQDSGYIADVSAASAAVRRQGNASVSGNAWHHRHGGPLMLLVDGVAGTHHFSGSWLGLDGSKGYNLRNEVGVHLLWFGVVWCGVVR